MSQLRIDLSQPPPKVEPSTAQRELNFVTVVNHPTGGFTLAVPINPGESTSRTYHQWFATKEAAEPLMRQHNRDICERYKKNPVFKDSIEKYLTERKSHGKP